MAMWLTKAWALLQASLEDQRTEMNGLDWKVDISHKGDRMAQHLAAFANHPGGGFLVFGIRDSGDVAGVDDATAKAIIHRVTNIARDALEPPLTIDYALEPFQETNILFVRVKESQVKPVHARGRSIEESHIRSGGSTRKASKQEIGALMLNSRTPRWEELHASVLLDPPEITARLDFYPVLEILEKSPPRTNEELLSWAVGEKFIEADDNGRYYVTNLGAVAVARKLEQFESISRKAMRVIVYNGKDKADVRLEQEGNKGYALGFKGLMDFISSQLPQSEIIERALRTKRTLYPEIALRELIANALIHQDFSISGAGPMVELFSNRIVISNPGGLLPSKKLDRLIGTQPESRNELLAKAFRRYRICEELGSGLIKAGQAVELWGLPPIKFEAGENFFRVTIFSPRSYADMSAKERLEACYQHAVLQYLAGKPMTNKSLRERLKMPDRHRSMVSSLLQQAVEAGLIRPSDPDNRSKKLVEYIPKWAA